MTLKLIIAGPTGDRIVEITHPDRLLLPELGITKANVAQYFMTVRSGLMATIRNRPTTLERWPAGVFPGARLATWKGDRGDGFYQRRVPRGAPSWVETVSVEGSDGSTLNVVCPDEPAVVLWAANLGSLTFHPWPVKRCNLDRPDLLVVDLDPQPGSGFRDAARVALELKDLLAELGMTGYPKTSGRRGIHVIVPVQPQLTIPEAHRALRALGHELVRRVPRLATMERLKKDRGGKIYVDCTPQTVASAYSIRPDPPAIVSAPVTWDELTDVCPEDLTITSMPARFSALGDLHGRLGQKADPPDVLMEMADRQESAAPDTGRR